MRYYASRLGLVNFCDGIRSGSDGIRIGHCVELCSPLVCVCVVLLADEIRLGPR